MKKIPLGLLVLTTTMFLTQGPGAFAAGRTLTDAQLRALAPPALNTIPVPGPANLADYVDDPVATLVLGKALFWDMQVGSDGILACASCHYQAGADVRAKNQLNPGSPSQFGVTPSGGGGPNDTLLPADFPFPKGLNDVVGSHGVFNRQFIGVTPGSDVDACAPLPDGIFQVGGIKTRRVTGRNTPTAVNAVFNLRNFWDGRASSAFNGQNPFGHRDATAGIWVTQTGGGLAKVSVALEKSSLASQAVGPPMSETEMSCAGRTWPDLGRKMLSLMPLAKQKVDPQDSVLGPLRNTSGTGLSSSYVTLIQQAFRPELWSGTDNVPGGHTQMEANFSFFWGVAVQMYESTLVSDQTRFDSFAALNDTALTETEKFGLELFVSQGLCNLCHGGPLFSNAATPVLEQSGFVDRILMMNSPPGIVDVGFHNLGVRQTLEDVGIGGSDAFGNPLSFASQLSVGPVVEPIPVTDPFLFSVNPGIPVLRGERTAVNGAFKAPILRNVELNGPYFHNGGHETLLQVLEFYDRQGDFRNENLADLDPDITNIRLNPAERDAIAAFLLALTDERVRQEQAPFDHPQLFLPNGHPGDRVSVVSTNPHGEADDQLYELPAVGASGRPAAGLPPLQAFPLVTMTLALTANPSGSTTAGIPVTFTAAAGGGSGPYEYEFQGRIQGGTFGVAQAYGATPSWVWPTTGVTPGTYEVRVNARNQGSTSPAEATQTIPFVISGAAASAVILTPSPGSPQTAGATVTFTAAASGGTGPYEYEFQGRIQGGTFGVAQAYGATPSWVWPTAGVTPGTYEVKVNARNQGSVSPAEATQTITFVISGAGTPANNVTLTPSPGSPQNAGATLTFSAAASGGSGVYEYEFQGRIQGGVWGVAQGYGATPSWVWSTAGVTPGTYEIRANARNQGSVSPAEATQTITYTLN